MSTSSPDPALVGGSQQLSDENEQAVLEQLLEKAGVTFEEARKIPVEQIRVMPNQPRREFDPKAMNSLIRGMAVVGQLQDGIVRPLREEELEEEREKGSPVRYELVDGERRFRACLELQYPFGAKVAVGLTPKIQYLVSVASNFNREPHSPLETALAIQNLRSSGYSVAETAGVMGMAEVTIYKYSRLMELDERVFELLGPPTPKEKRLRVSIAQELTRVAKEHQWEFCKKLGSKPTIGRARALIAKLLSENENAAHPDSRPRKMDAHSARLMMTRLAKRGEDTVSLVTSQAIQGIPGDKRRSLHTEFATLIETLGLLQKELAFDFPEVDASS